MEPHRRHCIVVLEQDIYSSLVLVQPRKTCPCLTERLLMGRKESNQTNKTIFLISYPKHVVGTQKNRLNETVLLSTQNTCLN